MSWFIETHRLHDSTNTGYELALLHRGRILCFSVRLNITIDHVAYVMASGVNVSFRSFFVLGHLSSRLVAIHHNTYTVHCTLTFNKQAR